MLNPVTDTFEASLRALLPDSAFKVDNTSYFVENRGRWAGHGLVLTPSDTEEVSNILRACFEARVPVVPYGGGTGLVGGQVLQGGERPVVLSLERMSRIRASHPLENTMIVEAGAILADVQQAARDLDRLFPLSLASEGSARIGGLLATNAGGVNVLRYGMARAQCLGLEAVLADGTIWNGLGRLRKDNTGYDLRDLMIGSEGTLGIITAASLKLSPIPAKQGTCMLAVKNPSAALKLLALAQASFGEGVSAFELMHRQGMDFLQAVGPAVKLPFANTPEWSVLIDIGIATGLDPQFELTNLFERGLENGLTSDGVIAQSQADRDALWRIRESIPEANKRIGSIASHDISVPLSELPEFIAKGHAALAELGEFRINCFGHVGDGNLHYNVFPPEGRSRAEYSNIRSEVTALVHDLVAEFDGSISAEHGIGRLKATDLEKYADPAKLLMMRAIKDALDPRGILNPGVVLNRP